MSEEEVNEEKPIDVLKLGRSELESLSSEQVAYVIGISLRRQSPRIFDAVKAALKGKENDVIRAMISAGYKYISPEIEIMPGLKVSFQTMYELQLSDVYETTATASRTAKSQNIAPAMMSKLFLCYSIHRLNGDYLGQTEFGSTFFEAMEQDIVSAEKTMIAAREKRMHAISRMSPTIITALAAAQQSFQHFVDGVVDYRPTGDIVADTERAQALVGEVGKSQGPDRAG